MLPDLSESSCHHGHLTFKGPRILINRRYPKRPTHETSAGESGAIGSGPERSDHAEHKQPDTTDIELELEDKLAYKTCCGCAIRQGQHHAWVRRALKRSDRRLGKREAILAFKKGVFKLGRKIVQKKNRIQPIGGPPIQSANSSIAHIASADSINQANSIDEPNTSGSPRTAAAITVDEGEEYDLDSLDDELNITKGIDDLDLELTAVNPALNDLERESLSESLVSGRALNKTRTLKHMTAKQSTRDLGTR